MRPNPRPTAARTAPTASEVLLSLTSLGTVALAIHAVAGRPWPAQGATLALAGCLVLSVWSPRLGSRCPSCDQATALVGALPLALIGALLYAGLFALSALGREPALLRAGLWGATGAHAVLVWMLWRTRVWCGPCVLTALLAFLALLGTRLDAAQGGHGWELALAPAAAVVTYAAARYGRALADARSEASVQRLAERFAHEPAPLGEARLRVLVYTREGCPACTYYEDVVRPALIAALGDRLDLEERDVGTEPAASPLFLVRGAETVAIVGLDPERGFARLLAAIESAAAAAPAPGANGPLAGVRVIDVA